MSIHSSPIIFSTIHISSSVVYFLSPVNSSDCCLTFPATHFLVLSQLCRHFLALGFFWLRWFLRITSFRWLLFCSCLWLPWHCSSTYIFFYFTVLQREQTTTTGWFNHARNLADHLKTQGTNGGRLSPKKPPDVVVFKQVTGNRSSYGEFKNVSLAPQLRGWTYLLLVADLPSPPTQWFFIISPLPTFLLFQLIWFPTLSTRPIFFASRFVSSSTFSGFLSRSQSRFYSVRFSIAWMSSKPIRTVFHILKYVPELDILCRPFLPNVNKTSHFLTESYYFSDLRRKLSVLSRTPIVHFTFGIFERYL